MAHEDHGAALALDRCHAAQALALELGVAHGQDRPVVLRSVGVFNPGGECTSVLRRDEPFTI
ncbi:MAG TPA: hypothetical protein VM264_12400, partial [Acidimicrobiales bacterium]|nr:hypothetical protein [Acidimicrobiales bacterium]